jgi:signal transduction histidine kinase
MAGRILVVEDEVVIAMEIESVLQQMGYEVIGPVMTGQDAIVMTAEKRPDLILMDIRLKGDLDGISTAEHIYHLYRIPVIFLTAHSDPKTVDKAIATHPFGYLIKPFRKNELYTSIEIALYKHRAFFAEQELKRELFKATVIDHITQYDIFNKALAINGYIELIGQDLPPDSPDQEYVKKAGDLVRHIRNRIRFEGEYSKLGHKTEEWQDIGHLIRSAADAVPLKNIIVENVTDPLEIFADPLFSQVFYHLFENALRHGGHVNHIKISLQEEGDHGILVIDDNGEGIPEPQKKALFSHNIQYGGGKGLFLVQEILEISGMTIAETGMPGVGARFEITVPGLQYRRKFREI